MGWFQNNAPPLQQQAATPPPYPDKQFMFNQGQFGGQAPFTPGPGEGPGGFTGHAQDPNWGQLGTIPSGNGNLLGPNPIMGENGGGQLSGPPISQIGQGGGPMMRPGQRNIGFAETSDHYQDYLNSLNRANPMQGGNAMGGGMVQLRAPTGEVKAVPLAHVSRLIGLGATRI